MRVLLPRVEPALKGLRLPPLPERSGAYRWLYVDVTCGELTAVAIFMVGSVFSARYASRLGKGALPLSHSAVNFALYRGGRRVTWVLSEYARAQVEGDHRLTIGGSSFEYAADGSIRVSVREAGAPFGNPVHAEMRLVPTVDSLGELSLVPGTSHVWCPLAARAQATLSVPSLGVGELHGVGYHDSNAGDTPLGGDIPGWRWSRAHGPHETVIDYQPPGDEHLRVTAGRGRIQVERVPAGSAQSGVATDGVTRWGLRVPRALGGLQAAPSTAMLLESSPFYARLEARPATGVHVLSEVADFKRFHSPLIRWMAHFRTRVEKAR